MSLVDDAIIAASLTTAAGGVLYVAGGVRALIRKADRQDQLIFGDGTQEHPGLERWQAETSESIRNLEGAQKDLHKELDAIHAQLRPNGGASLRDAVNRVEKAVKSIPKPREGDDA